MCNTCCYGKELPGKDGSAPVENLCGYKIGSPALVLPDRQAAAGLEQA